MHTETQISGWLLIAIGAFTLAKLDGFFCSFDEDRSSSQLCSIALSLKSSFLTTYMLELFSQTALFIEYFICYLLINSRQTTYCHKPLCPACSCLIINDQSWKEQLRRFWTTPSHFSGSLPGKTPDRKPVCCPWQNPTRSSKMPKRRQHDMKRGKHAVSRRVMVGQKSFGKLLWLTFGVMAMQGLK